MDHGDIRDTITDLLRRVRALEVENRGLKLTLYGAVVRGGQGIEVAEGSYIGAGPDVRLGTLTAGGWGVQIPYKGKPASVESLIWDREVQASAAQTTADQAHDRMDPGGDMNNWVTAVSDLANGTAGRLNPGGDMNNWVTAISNRANGAHDRMNPGGDINSWIARVEQSAANAGDRSGIADAIRTLVQNDINTRDALMSLAQQTGKTISPPHIISPSL